MRKALLIVVLTLLAVVAVAQNADKSKGTTHKHDVAKTQSELEGDELGFVDLGLPSGTKWRSYNAPGMYTYEEAVNNFRTRLPTKEQWEELKSECQWVWNGNGYTITGPNNDTISLPVVGFRNCDGTVSGSKSAGNYWSSTPYNSSYAWEMYFGAGGTSVYRTKMCYIESVRLVKNK